MSGRRALPLSHDEKAARRRAVLGFVGVGAVLILGLAAVVTAFVYLAHQPLAAAPVSTAPTIEIPDAQPVEEVVPEVPPTTSQEALSELPLADTWAVIPSLIEQSVIEDRIDDSIWTVAQPVDEFTGLYAEQSPDAEPVAALGFWAVEDRSTLAVFAHEENWLLGRVAKSAGEPVECRGEAEAGVVVAGGLV